MGVLKTAADVAQALGGGKKSGNGYMCRCPVHEDRTPSLSVSDGEDGRLLVHCHAGCDQADVFAAVREIAGLNGQAISWSGDSRWNAPAGKPRPATVPAVPAVPIRLGTAGTDLYAHPSDLAVGGHVPSDIWRYTTRDGRTAGYVARYDLPEGGKSIRPWVHDGSRWMARAMPEPRPLYACHKLITAPKAPVLLVEGEKAAEAGRALFSGVVVSTWAGGASAVSKTDFTALAGRKVILSPDNDAPGFAAMEQVAALLQGLRCEIWLVKPPEGAGASWDVADAVWTVEEAAAWLAGAEQLYAPPRAALLYEDFAAQLQPAEWVIEPVIQRGQCGCLTARTNHGKTAVSLYKILCVASGRSFAGYKVRRGNVLLFCGEDPDGVRIRLIATAAAMGVSREDLARVMVVPEAFGLAGKVEQRCADIVSQFPSWTWDMVVVDTSAAYFHGDKEDDNVQARDHAMAVRKLKHCLPGRPAVLVNCHPTKAADRDNLLPRGGSAFLNELDFNLSLWSDGEAAEFHWHAKKRGPDFDPCHFEFHAKTVEVAGMRFDTVIALPISEERERTLSRTRTEDENRVLYAMGSNPKGSISDWCAACGWSSAMGVPSKSKLHRILGRLAADKLVRKYRGVWVLTEQGRKEALE